MKLSQKRVATVIGCTVFPVVYGVTKVAELLEQGEPWVALPVGVITLGGAALILLAYHLRPRTVLRGRAELGAGELVRFRNKRYFFSPFGYATMMMLIAIVLPLLGIVMDGGLWVALGIIALWIVTRVVFVIAVPPKGGRRMYEVTATGLVVDVNGNRRTIAWDDIEQVRYRPSVNTAHGSYATIHYPYAELTLRDTDDHLCISGTHHQSKLSELIIDHSRKPIVDRLRATFDQTGQIEIGELVLTRAGVYGHGGFVPWRNDWSLDHTFDENGVTLVIAEPDGHEVKGWVPEEQTALDLLTSLAHLHTT